MLRVTFVKMPNEFSNTLLSCSAVGFPAGLLWLRGVLLHPAGEKSGDPTPHGLPTQPHNTQHDCGKSAPFSPISV